MSGHVQKQKGESCCFFVWEQEPDGGSGKKRQRMDETPVVKVDGHWRREGSKRYEKSISPGGKTKQDKQISPAKPVITKAITPLRHQVRAQSISREAPYIRRQGCREERQGYREERHG